MSPERRAELLAIAPAAEVIDLAERCLARHGSPLVLQRPEVGLVMMQVREPVCRERFHVGEVLVTRAEVEIGGVRGWSMRMGADRVATLAAAICDAVAAASVDLADAVVCLCERSADAAVNADAHEWADLAPTIVDFEEMD